MNPPRYESSINQQGYYNPAAYTDARENDNLLPPSQQFPDYGSAPTPRNQKRSHIVTVLQGFFLLVAMSLIILPIYFSSQQVWDKRRNEWEAEERAHQVTRNAWNSERREMVEERRTWRKEWASHILERKEIVAERDQWRRERNDHEIRERQERDAMAAEREKWRKERIAHEIRERQEREAIAAEREQWRRERADHENRERQEEEEKRALIVWENLTASTQCLRYGTREYSAKLAHVPLGLDPLKECWKKSIDIRGRQLFPSRCDTQVCYLVYIILSSILKYFRECAGLSQATGSSTLMKLHALHGGEVTTTRYSSPIYFNFRDTLMATTGLRRTRNPCSSSCY